MKSLKTALYTSLFAILGTFLVGQATLACTYDVDLGTNTAEPLITSSTVGQGNDFVYPQDVNNKNPDYGKAAEDVIYLWTAPATGYYTFSTNGTATNFDTVLFLLNGTSCEDELLVVDDDKGLDTASLIQQYLTKDQKILIVVDGWENKAGNYNLNIINFNSTDQDTDGHDDINDCNDFDETIYPGATEVSDDGFDQNCDYYDDIVCENNGELLSNTGLAMASGSTQNSGNNFMYDFLYYSNEYYNAYDFSYGYKANDYIYNWTAPATGEYTVSTVGSDFDTVLFLVDGNSCANTNVLAVNDDMAHDSYDSLVTVNLVAGQPVRVVVDGWEDYAGNYILNIIPADKDNDGATILNDCNDNDDDLITTVTYYADNDGDNLGDANNPVQVCSNSAPAGYVTDNTDTDDSSIASTIPPKTEPVPVPPATTTATTNTNTNTNTVTPVATEPNPNDPATFAATFSDVKGAKNGNIKLTKLDGTVIKYNIFDIDTDTKTKAKLYQNTGWILVTQPFGKSIKLMNPYTGEIKASKKLSEDIKYQQTSLKQYNLRPKQDNNIETVVTSKNNDNKVLVTIINIDTVNYKLTVLDSVKLTNNLVDPGKTKLGDSTIKLRDEQEQVLVTLSVGKDYQITK
ncbi:MAG: putative metal-binding motif-containing protein [Patescibacteria group bacterium]|jgi:hypothetical protein